MLLCMRARAKSRALIQDSIMNHRALIIKLTLKAQTKAFTGQIMNKALANRERNRYCRCVVGERAEDGRTGRPDHLSWKRIYYSG